MQILKKALEVLKVAFTIFILEALSLVCFTVGVYMGALTEVLSSLTACGALSLCIVLCVMGLLLQVLAIAYIIRKVV